MSLRSVPPEPVTPSSPTPGIPVTGGMPFTSRTISVLQSVQKWAVIPFAVFSAVHLAGVVVAPALFGADTANELINMGRELYQTSSGEPIVLGSAAVHVTAGVLVNLLRKYVRYRKYGSSKYKEKEQHDLAQVQNEQDNIQDVNKGLGGLSSILGFGTRRSLTYRWFGLSPLSFSGYVFLLMVTGHVLKMRVNPLLMDGDSSYIDLSYVTYAFSNFVSVRFMYPVMVFTGCYHMISGAARFLKLYSRRARKAAYAGIFALSVLGVVSVVRITHLEPVVGKMAAKFAAYIDYM